MDEALKYGFRRVTPMDDCSNQFLGKHLGRTYGPTGGRTDGQTDRRMDGRGRSHEQRETTVEA